jgi:hypothetical protein
MKMGRRLRCPPVTYRSRDTPSSVSPALTALPASHFERNKLPLISGTGHQAVNKRTPRSEPFTPKKAYENTRMLVPGRVIWYLGKVLETLLDNSGRLRR